MTDKLSALDQEWEEQQEKITEQQKEQIIQLAKEYNFKVNQYNIYFKGQ